MKNSSASRRWRVLAVAALGYAAAGRAYAGAAEDGLACLERADLACAERALASGASGSAGELLAARVAFHRADFDGARARMKALAAAHPEDSDLASELAHVEATADAAAGFVVERRGDVEVRYLPGIDRVLVDECLETLQASHDRVAPQLGGAPPIPVRVELYPTADRFIAASGLPAEAVRTTGVVALSKWDRLLITSPRALGRGYPWRDTLAHEYIHLVVAWRSGDKAPVWLQEGIARSHEPLWARDDFPPMAPTAQALLAKALGKNALVPLARMHPSMAYLDSAEEAALAFAQVSTMIEHLRGVAGPRAVADVLTRVRDGTDALEAVAGVAGRTPDGFLESWKGYLRGLSLIARKLAVAPTILGASDDPFGEDPVLSSRADLAGHARLGDLLLARKHAEAALAEYRKAMPPEEPPSPTIVAREAQALLALGRRDEAVAHLQESVAVYPEFPLTRTTLGGLFVAQGRTRDALAQYRAAADVHPFDATVQSALSDLHGAAGQAELAARHARYRRILDLGGEPPTHGASR
jgi:tetratricopeptide (TPR) repeat protein